ncbi:MAG: N-acetylmuramoyl-L-alanine amidase [Ignavibacteriales bacterium]|nr:N-acetylmuramoyl-L-alanine amidase [Ignavibacteriales bacterium]
MLRKLLSLLLFIPCTVFAAEVVQSDSLYMRFVSPERDSIRSSSPRGNFAACTNPSAKVFINGKEVKVYGSGAFIGSVNLAVGVNPVRVVARAANGDSLVKTFFFTRSEPPKPLMHEPAVIDVQSIEPRQNLWLGKDDILEVKFRGSPGYKAYFDIEDVESGIPMLELPASDSISGSGIYIGRYKVRESDETRQAPVRVRLKKSFWGSEKAFSNGKISILPKELPRVAMVTGRRPFLNAGLGEDRLGGAKLGYIQAGIRVQVVGKVGRQYKICLSNAMIGWLPEDFAQLLPVETPQPRSLVGSISTSGNVTEDVVSVSLNQRLPYLANQVVDPPALVVDIFGATSNTNWITQHRSATGVKSVSWNQVGDDHYRLTVALNNAQHWGYDVGYDQGSNLRIRVRKPPKIANPDSVLAGFTIAVDAGHGGDATGAVGATGVQEKDVNLAIASRLRSLLQSKGVNVVMTRTDDTNVGMPERTDAIINGGAQILVSIHCNAGGAGSDAEAVRGTSAYYRHLGYQPLADIMYGRMLELGLNQFGMVGSFNFSLNAPTQLPNVLVETAFLSNPDDEMKLLDDSFRKAIAGKITAGLEQFVKAYAQPAEKGKE